MPTGKRDASPDSPGDPCWELRFDRYDPQDEDRREAVLALGNGVFAIRAASVDAVRDDLHYPGVYHAGFYDRVPNHIAGERDVTESLVNLPNPLRLVFRIDGGAWLRLDDLHLPSYEHALDMRAGIARRVFVARDGAGRHTRVREERFVSMADPGLCALRLEITPQDWRGTVEVRGLIDGDVVNDNVAHYEDYRHRHLAELDARAPDDGALLVEARTSDRRNAIAIAARTRCDAAGVTIDAAVGNGSAAHLLRAQATEGCALAIERTVALCTSIDGAGDPARHARQALHAAGDYRALRAAHARAWQALWSRAAIDADDAALARPLRLHAFHILQTASPHTAAIDAGIPARGWHGEGYHGHVFWDELFVLPFLNHRFPDIARAALLYRYRRLDAAREAARAEGLRGAMYPWRSAGDGREVTPRHQKNLLTGEWMRDHTYRQRHIGSAIAFNVWQYWLATGDDAFLADHGAEMMLEIARFWAAIAVPNAAGRYEIRGVIGPDEYHNLHPVSGEPGLDNNAYTNLMAVWTLCHAPQALARLPAARTAALRRRLGLGDDELALWERIGRRMHIPFQDDGILAQFDGFERLPPFDPASLPPHLASERTDWALRATGRRADDLQVTKQADALTLFHLLREDDVIALLARLGYGFDRARMRHSADYHLARTTHRSSLSRIVYAGALAQVDPEGSWRLYREALHTDLDPMKGESVAEGIHLGAMGGTLDILQRRYFGLHATADGLRVEPALPAALGRVRLGLRYRGSLLDARSCGDALELHADPSNRDTVTVICGDGVRALPPGGMLRVQGAS